MKATERFRARLDDVARRRPAIGFPVAVVKKFGEDRAGQLAALIAYYGFFSLFPLMLVFVTVLGFVLRGHAELQARILGSALGQFPIIGDQIRENVGSLSGSALALAVGLAGALWAGLAGVKAAQRAMDTVWNVPMKDRPRFAKATLRAVAMLGVLGGFSLVATALAGVSAGGTDTSMPLKVAGMFASAAVNVVVFVLAFKILTVAELSWRDVLPGAVAAGIAWSVLQSTGSYYVGHQLKNASQTYGFFAVVIGLLSWLYLGAQTTLLCAEINVVRVRKLWPRSIAEGARAPAVSPARAAAATGHEPRGRKDRLRRGLTLGVLAFAVWRRFRHARTGA